MTAYGSINSKSSDRNMELTQARDDMNAPLCYLISVSTSNNGAYREMLMHQNCREHNTRTKKLSLKSISNYLLNF